MKFNLKSLLVFSALVSLVVSSNLQSGCENPCVACQRTVYQLKFQQIADCGKNHTCKNTCFKVKELWNNSPDHIFEPFQKDVFGKCEICFRAGFCGIAECKAQQEKEMEVIDQIVNRSHLTVKKHALLNDEQFPQFRVDTMFYDPNKLLEIEKKIDNKREEINQQLDASLIHKSAKHPIDSVNDVMKNYFPQDGAFSGKSVNGGQVEAEKQKVDKFVEATDKYVKHVKKIIELKKSAKNQSPEDAKKVNEIAAKAAKDISHKIHESKKVLKKSANNHQSPAVKEVVKTSIKELAQLKKEISH